MVPISGKKIQILTRLSKVLLQPDPPPRTSADLLLTPLLSLTPTISSRLFSRDAFCEGRKEDQESGRAVIPSQRDPAHIPPGPATPLPC